MLLFTYDLRVHEILLHKYNESDKKKKKKHNNNNTIGR